MAHEPLHAVVRHIRKVSAALQTDQQDDQDLLERFIDERDGTAFVALVQRHGPMVRGVCRRLLRRESDADDAFQATFLVFLNKARSIRKRRSLGSWLHGVAIRTALRAKTNAAQRHVHEQQATAKAPDEPWKEAAWREICTVLDEEVQGLSETYRAPLVLCYLEGRTRDEAAHQLGWSLRTLQRRLERGRDLLRIRLTRRGLTLSAGLLATALAEHTGRAALPVGLANLTAKAALGDAAGTMASAGLTSGPAAALAKGVLKAMFINKLTALTALTAMALAVGIIGTGAGLWTYQALAAQRADTTEQKTAAPAKNTKEKKAAEPAAEPAEELPSLIRVPSQRDGIVRVIGTEIKEGEQVPPKETVTVKIGGEVKKYRRLKKGDAVEEGQLLAQLDDDLARADMAIKTAKLAAAYADSVVADQTRNEAQERYKTQKKLYDRIPAPATTQEDLRGALLTFNRYAGEAVSKVQAIEVATQELNQARKLLEVHEIRSPSRGVIKTIYKRPGEAVKYLETVFLIQVPEE